jgi:single-stranded DNA-binding protein|uniref:Single-stranded DNA binding protein n=1 Tax=Asterionellopsis glacialis TaxID=33640 RepID=A0A023HAA3_9STRA|nr:hypothetical protein [Asterionellopsis glacialis]AGH28284.1 hypothetical protein [Asterionellopsis glacialis]
MNYTSFLVKIVEKPNQIFVNKIIPLTEMTVQIPQVRITNKKTIDLSIWGKLGYDITQYYQINDYVIVEGYLSIRDDLVNEDLSKSGKRVNMSVSKIYPFILR